MLAVLFVLNRVQCIECFEQCSMFRAHCTVYTVQLTLHSAEKPCILQLPTQPGLRERNAITYPAVTTGDCTLYTALEKLLTSHSLLHTVLRDTGQLTLQSAQTAVY